MSDKLNKKDVKGGNMDILEIKREFLEMKEKTENIRRSLWLRKEKINYKGVGKINFWRWFLVW